MPTQTRPKFEGILQGPIGSELRRRPDATVPQVMKEYVAAGAHIGVSNSFGLTPYRVAGQSAPDRRLIPSEPFTRENHVDNQIAVQLTRRLYGDRLVAGSVGPLTCTSGRNDQFWESLSSTQRIEWAENRHAPQVEALLSAEPDLVLAEALRYNAEAIAIARLVRDFEGRMVAVCFEANRHGLPHVLPGDEATFRELKARLKEEVPEVDVYIGANCAGTSVIESIIARGDELDVVYANSLDFRGDQAAYDRFVALETGSRSPDQDVERALLKAQLSTTREQFSTFTESALRAGVKVIGGCCGTTADTVRIFRTTWDQAQRKPIEPTDESSIMRLAF